jgi:hypothetical protein
MGGIMLGKTLLNFKILILCICITCVSCDLNERNSDKLSKVEINKLFFEKRSDFNLVVDFCENNSNVRYVDKLNYSLFDEEYQDDELEKNLRLVRESLRKINGLSLKCGRRADYDGNPLSVVEISVYSQGISVSGIGQKIIFYTDWTYINNASRTDEQRKLDGEVPIGPKGWFHLYFES